MKKIKKRKKQKKNPKAQKVEEEKVNKDEEEEEEVEVEVEEEVEEKEDEEVEDDEKNEEPTKLPQKTKNGLDISMELIKKLKESSIDDSDVLILYFHKLCVPFDKILSSLDKKDIVKIFLNSLKESYYLFADSQRKHFNYKYIAKKTFPNLKKSDEKSLISMELSSDELNEPLPSTPSVFTINEKILELGLESNGKLDVYSKIHILKALINLVNAEKLNPFTKDFQQMENDLI